MTSNSWCLLLCCPTGRPCWQYHDLISHSVTISWPWTNQSLPYPNNAKHLVRKWQVSMTRSWVWTHGLLLIRPRARCMSDVECWRCRLTYMKCVRRLGGRKFSISAVGETKWRYVFGAERYAVRYYRIAIWQNKLRKILKSAHTKYLRAKGIVCGYGVFKGGSGGVAWLESISR